MGIIWFNIPEAYKYLMENGEVYTLRDHPKALGKAMLNSSLEGKPYYKGMVIIEFTAMFSLYSPTIKELSIYVGKSGFASVKKWLSKLNKEKNVFYLYHVRKI